MVRQLDHFIAAGADSG